ncbi:MAG: hypothetical protein ACRDDY_13760 [Clostridium sp.]|uniref:hypothetical protein n=1 Tax=Clostridium sp. TaxID=1506 RepID=UPI003EE4A8DA
MKIKNSSMSGSHCATTGNESEDPKIVGVKLRDGGSLERMVKELSAEDVPETVRQFLIRRLKGFEEQYGSKDPNVQIIQRMSRSGPHDIPMSRRTDSPTLTEAAILAQKHRALTQLPYIALAGETEARLPETYMYENEDMVMYENLVKATRPPMLIVNELPLIRRMHHNRVTAVIRNVVRNYTSRISVPEMTVLN